MWRFYSKGTHGRNRLRFMSAFNVYNDVSLQTGFKFFFRLGNLSLWNPQTFAILRALGNKRSRRRSRCKSSIFKERVVSYLFILLIHLFYFGGICLIILTWSKPSKQKLQPSTTADVSWDSFPGPPLSTLHRICPYNGNSRIWYRPAVLEKHSQQTGKWGE